MPTVTIFYNASFRQILGFRSTISSAPTSSLGRFMIFGLHSPLFQGFAVSLPVVN